MSSFCLEFNSHYVFLNNVQSNSIATINYFVNLDSSAYEHHIINLLMNAAMFFWDVIDMDLYYRYDVRNDIATKLYELAPVTLTAKFKKTLRPDICIEM